MSMSVSGMCCNRSRSTTEGTRKMLLGVLLIAILYSGMAYAQPSRPPVIDITKAAFEAIPVAIVPFEIKGRTDPKIQAQLHEILKYDLEFSGYFYLLPNQGQILEIERLDKQTDKINHSSWRDIGADAVIKGSVTEEAGKVDIELYIYWCKGAYRIVGRRYNSETRHFRQLVHRLSDEIVYRLTGNQGIAQTRFAFIYETREQGQLYKELYLIDYDGAPESMVRLTFDRSIITTPAWSPDGKEIAFTSYYYKNPDLFVLNLAEGKRRVVSNFPGLNTCPSWHPEGRQILNVLSKDGNSEIYRIDLQGGRPFRLTNDPAIDSSPAYSPDGNRIAFTSDRGRVVQLYVMDADGRNARRISPGRGWFDTADWAPWGDTLAFIASMDANRRFDIYTSNSDGSNMQQLTQGPGNSESPSWAPDGRHIVFCSNRDGNWNLYTMSRDGKNVRRITFLPGNCYSPEWSPIP